MPARSLLLALVALLAGAAGYLATRSIPARIGAGDADFYCYELKRSWTCAYLRQDCEERLAQEKAEEIVKSCRPHSTYAVSP